MLNQQSSMGFLSDMEAQKQSLTLADRFVVPPFSILDTRQGYWQERKRQWLALGIRSEAGREHLKATAGIEAGYASGRGNETGGSIFDAVLCELVYKWFCPIEGTILDQFAGGSVRGIVAETLGYKYTGIEIRKEQIEANLEQAKALQLSPTYILGDCTKTLELLPPDIMYDLIFTCPPYYDLEIYTSIVEDIGEMNNMGNMSAHQSYFSFMIWYELIFEQAVSRLKNNRFLVVVVGDIRDKEGIYRGFVADNIACFNKLGLKFYNEAILINVAGSLPVRVSNQFPNGRKLGKSHQNVLIFYKGNPDKIKELRFIDKIDNNNV